MAAAPAVTGTLDEVVLARLDLWPVLVLVPAVVAVFVWGARRRRQAMRSLGNAVLVERLVATVNHRNRILQATAVVLAVACLCVATLRPQFGGAAEIVPASGVDVVLAVDYSKSMLARDVYPSRSERLEAELARFLEEARARGDRVGVVVFAGEARGLPVSRDTRLLEMYLERADPRTENPGGTAIGKALRLSLGFLVDARAGNGEAGAGDGEVAEGKLAAGEQAIVLLTDGEDNVSRPQEVAAEAAKLGVRIFSVGIGSRSGEPIQRFNAEGEPDGYVTDDDSNYVMTRLDEGLLEELAKTTGGEFIRVEAESFGLDEVRDVLAELSTAERKDTIEIHREEGFAFLVIPGFVFLSLALAVGDRRRREDS